MKVKEVMFAEGVLAAVAKGAAAVVVVVEIKERKMTSQKRVAAQRLKKI
jgi:hypothetical protein